MNDLVLCAIDARGVVTVTLSWPEPGNAYDADMLAALIDDLGQLEADHAVRALVIRGAGKHFQAGADINWLARVAEYPPEQAYAASDWCTKLWPPTPSNTGSTMCSTRSSARHQARSRSPNIIS